MSKNIEVKAYYADLELARKICLELGATLTRSHSQTDTYLQVPGGRLKMRESNKFEPCLIYYNRLDMPEIRESSYTKLPIDKDYAEDFRRVLSESIGVRMRINKQRDTFELDGALINIDNVEALGTFIEIEVDAERNPSAYEDAQGYAAWLKDKLKIDERDILPWSYAELQAMTIQATQWQSRLVDCKQPVGRLFLIDGPSGSGKTTIAEMLREEDDLRLQFVQRHCTRKSRTSEESEYVFVSIEDFKRSARAGEFLEYRDFKFGMSYGLEWRNAISPLLEGKNALALMNWGNARHVKRLFPEARLILITASEDDLKRRLVSRGTHDEAQLAERLGNARRIAGNGADHHLVVQNNDG
jgi:guanylate kinase/adenylate cyclase class IV